MNVPLISHVNADGDILDAWFRHYLGIGVSSFHLVIHGPEHENRALHGLVNRYPVHIEDAYEGAFDPWEKRDRLNRVLGKFRGSWVVEADSDEFLELPFRRLQQTARMLRIAGKDVLFAPMLQHLCRDGGLDTPDTMTDPFETQPLCSVDLYALMGCSADIRKYPLFFNREGIALFDGGNHNRPVGLRSESAAILGVTHHFKFRRQVRDRLLRRANSAHPYREQSVDLYSYLERHDMRLPLDGAFIYSRRELFRRRLLARPGPREFARKLLRAVRIRK